MPKHNRQSKKTGLPPGTLVHIGEKITENPLFYWVSYNAEDIRELSPDKLSDLPVYDKSDKTITWLDLVGINHLETVEKIGEIYGLHPLVMEDIVNTEQRPKFEEFSGYTFFTLKKATYGKSPDNVSLNQVSIVFGHNFVLTFREEESEVFSGIKKRLLSGVGRVRNKKSDFLVYYIIDSIVDGYFDIIETIADEIETVEERMMKDTNGKSIYVLQRLKRNLSYMLKSLYPLREALSKLEKRDNPFIEEDTLPYFRDVYDHSIHIIESIESQRDILSGVMDVYLTSLNNRMNSIMKVLTVIATIFMPLSFFASVYGMNFRYFPEIQWKYGYLYFWIMIILVVLLMFYYFRKKKWM